VDLGASDGSIARYMAPGQENIRVCYNDRGWKRPWGALLGLVLLWGPSCAPVGPSRSYVRPKAKPADLLAYYDYPQHPIEAQVEVKARRKRYDMYLSIGDRTAWERRNSVASCSSEPK
jgi:hypothetical protein